MTLAPSRANKVSQAYARDGKGPMVYGRYKEAGYKVEPLVDKLGTRITENVSGTEAFRIAGLDWQAEKREAYFMGQDGPEIAPDHCSIVRSDNGELMHLAGKGYTPVQHTAIADLFNYLSGEIEIENVLSIRRGKKVYATASIKAEGEVVPGDRVRRYLHAFNSHDGSCSFGVFFTDVRLACANQLGMLTKRESSNRTADGQGLRMRHTKSVSEFAQRLPQMIDLERQTFHKQLDGLRDLAGIPLTAELAKRVLETTFNDKLVRPIRDKQSKEMRQRHLNDLPEYSLIREHCYGSSGFGMDMKGVQGTVYGLFNGITQCLTHDGGHSKDTTERNRARLESLWGGAASKRIEAAREACLALV